MNRPLPTVVARRAEEPLAHNAMDAARAAADQTEFKLQQKQRKVQAFQRKTAARSAQIRAAAEFRKMSRGGNRTGASISGNLDASSSFRGKRGAPAPPTRFTAPGSPRRGGGANGAMGLQLPLPPPPPPPQPESDPNASDDNSLASSTGLEIPEGSELALRMVAQTEQHCILWGVMQSCVVSEGIGVSS